MRYALSLSYDGSQFFGWQKQAQGVMTVQETLENALSIIAGEKINTITAGRTDTGVHATAQVVHFDSDTHRPLSAWVRGVNAHLPDSIAVWHAQEVDAHFHARFDACARRYRYVLQSSPVRTPLLYGRAGWTHYALDVDKMQQAAALLLGEHDFSSFRASQCQAKSPIKTMYQITFSGSPSFIKMDFYANAFLHHMIRNIVGTLLPIGDGRHAPEKMAEVLASRSRAQAGVTAAAHGLYFMHADYPEHFALPAPVTQSLLW